MQTKVFTATNFDTVFSSFKSTLMDLGYIIKSQDYQGGFILAQTKKQTRSHYPNSIDRRYWNNSNYRRFDRNDFLTGRTLNLSINLEKKSMDTINSRIIAQKINHYSETGSSGLEFLDPEYYSKIYKLVEAEINKRKVSN